MPRTARRLLATTVLSTLVPATMALASLGMTGTASAADTIPPIGPGPSSNHAGVTCVQQALEIPMNGDAYGTYGKATYAAVRAFQAGHDLPVDGAVGPRTAAALLKLDTTPAGCASHLPTTSTSTSDPNTSATTDTSDASTSATSTSGDSASGDSASGSSDRANETPAQPDRNDRSGRGARPQAPRAEPPQLEVPLTGTSPAVATAPVCTEGSRSAAAAVAKATTVTEPTTRRTGDTYDPATIKLRYSAASHCAWAWIGGQPGSRVWLERQRRTDAGRIATESGPMRDIAGGNDSTYGAAQPLDAATSWVRACGQVREAPLCTLWTDGTRTVEDTTTSQSSSGTANDRSATASNDTGAQRGTPAPETGGDAALPAGDGAQGEAVASYARRVLNGNAVGAHPEGVLPYSWGAGHGTKAGPSLGTCAGYTGRIHPCPADSTVGLDCSGFTRWVYQLAYGRDVLGAGNTDSQLARMHKVSTPQPGDLVFYSPTGTPTGTTHVAVYIGGGKIIDAPATGRDISQETVGSHSTKVGFYRL